MLLDKIEGFQVPTTVPTGALDAITQFYTHTFVRGARFLTLSELTTERTINGIPTSFRQIAQEALFYLPAGAAALRAFTGGDTNESITSLMNAATRSMTSVLITAYGTSYTTWSLRGVTITKAPTEDPSGASLTSAVLSARNAYLDTTGHWPVLITAIQNYMRNTLFANTVTAYGLLTGTPEGTGKLGRSSKPVVNTMDALNGTLIGSQVGATTCGFFWSTSTMGTGISGGTIISSTLSGNFTGAISSPIAGTTYYYKAWATNDAGTSYGVERTFVHATAPTLGALTITTSSTSFTVSGTFNNGGAPIIEKGVAWTLSTSLPSNWTTHINTTANRTCEVTGNSLNSVIGGLLTQTNYTFVGYARNAVGIGISSPLQKFIPLFRTTFFSAPITNTTVNTITISWTDPNPGYTVARSNLDIIPITLGAPGSFSINTGGLLENPYTRTLVNNNSAAAKSYSITLTLQYDGGLSASATVTATTQPILAIEWNTSGGTASTWNSATATSITKRYIISNLPPSYDVTLQRCRGQNEKTNIGGTTSITANGTFTQEDVTLSDGCDIGYFYLNINTFGALGYTYTAPTGVYAHSICSYLKGGYSIRSFSYSFGNSPSSTNFTMTFDIRFNQPTTTITDIGFNFDFQNNTTTYTNCSCYVNSLMKSGQVISSSALTNTITLSNGTTYTGAQPTFITFNSLTISSGTSTQFIFDKCRVPAFSSAS
jgi:hypothetical protein